MSDPDFSESPEATRWRVLITTISLTCGGLATLSVLLRLYACRKTGSSIRAEDNLMIVAGIFMWGSTAGALLKAYNGIGVPSDQLPESRATLLALGSWLIPKFWSISMACSKISIIIFINRAVSLSRRVNIVLFLVALCVYAYAGVVFFFSFFMCQPVAYYWNKSLPNGSCVSNRMYMIQNIATAILALLTDAAILVVPIPAILRLKLQRKRKIAVIAVFGMGTIICVFSLLRVVQFVTFDTDHISTSSASETIWTLLENDWSIICGCAPQVASLFQSFRESTPYAMGYSGSYDPYGIAFRYPKTLIKTTVSSRTDGSSCSASTWNRNSSEVELRGIEVHTAINQEICRASQLYKKDRMLASRLTTI